MGGGGEGVAGASGEPREEGTSESGTASGEGERSDSGVVAGSKAGSGAKSASSAGTAGGTRSKIGSESGSGSDSGGRACSGVKSGSGTATGTEADSGTAAGTGGAESSPHSVRSRKGTPVVATANPSKESGGAAAQDGAERAPTAEETAAAEAEEKARMERAAEKAARKKARRIAEGLAAQAAYERAKRNDLPRAMQDINGIGPAAGGFSGGSSSRRLGARGLGTTAASSPSGGAAGRSEAESLSIGSKKRSLGQMESPVVEVRTPG